MSKGIAFFDFDGTITTKDTMLQLVKFYKGKQAYYGGMLKLLPWLIGMKLNLVSNTLVKEKFLALFFKGMSIKTFQEVCDDFVKNALPQLIRPQALATIQQLQQEGVSMVVVTASADNWVKGWCDCYGIACIGSCLEVKEGKLTGKLNGANCHKEEKVRRIKEQYQLSDFSTIYCYGDTKGDLPMLQLATHAFYKPFRDTTF